MFIENSKKHKISIPKRVRRTLFLKIEPYDLASTSFMEDILQLQLGQPFEKESKTIVLPKIC
jgi:hypothetical protein